MFIVSLDVLSSTAAFSKEYCAWVMSRSNWCFSRVKCCEKGGLGLILSIKKCVLTAMGFSWFKWTGHLTEVEQRRYIRWWIEGNLKYLTEGPYTGGLFKKSFCERALRERWGPVSLRSTLEKEEYSENGRNYTYFIRFRRVLWRTAYNRRPGSLSAFYRPIQGKRVERY